MTLFDVSGAPCPSCGSREGTPGLSHGAPGDASLAGLLCSVLDVQALLSGDHPESTGEESDPDYCADLLGQALARYRGEA